MILVFCELKDGKLRKPSTEALSEGRRLADASGKSLGALFVGASNGGASDAAIYGADVILTCEAAHLASYSSDAFANAISDAVKTKGATVLLGGATAMGKDALPRAAARLGAGYAGDVTSLSMVDGKLQAVRPVYAGKAFATTAFSSNVQVATTRPNVFAATEKSGAGVVESLPAPAGDFKAIVKEILAKGSGKADLTEANIIVSGGRGTKDPKEANGWALLEDMAKVLGAAVGASRAAVDAGWRGHDDQVGQTGKVVNPTLYFAVGISGAIQHLAGMSSAKCIVAINKDTEAAIFSVADYGIVGDMFTVVPMMTEELKKLIAS